MNSRGIDQNDLASFASLLLGNIDDAKDAVARGLRLWRNDGQLLTDQRIQQRALARIWATENANESGVEGHLLNRVLGFSGGSTRLMKDATTV